MNLFRDLKINYKLTLILGIVLIGFVATAFGYRTLLDANEQALKDLERLSRFELLIGDVHVGLFKGRAYEKEFFLNKNLSSIEAFEAQMTPARESLTALGKAAPQGIDRNEIKNLQNLFREYHGALYLAAEAQMKLGIKEDDGLQGEVSRAALELERALEGVNSVRLSNALLHMRSDEKDFIARGDDAYAKAFARNAEDFRQNLVGNNVASATRDQLGQLLTIYQTKFNEQVRARQYLDQQLAALADTVNRLTPLFDSAIQNAERVLTAGQQRIEAKSANLTRILTIGLVVIGAIVALVLLMFSRALARPMRRLHDTVTKIGLGDFSARARLKNKDELGQLGNAFDNLLDERLAQLQQAEQENEQLNDSIIVLMEAASELSQRDLTISVPVREDVTGPVADAINLMANETSKVLREIRSIAEQVAGAAKTVKEQGEKVSSVAAKERKIVENTIIRLDEASKAMGEIASLAQTCNEIASRASESTDKALNTVTNTVDGMHEIRETISETEKRIKRLGERSQEISGIVEIINNIADRTHVLALNASMQAAAAGDAGRGFAVVADEVQRLAESSRNSTSQIAALVKNIQAETSETMATMNKTISQVVDGSSLAEQAGRQMVDTKETTSELVSAVRRIANQSADQSKMSNDLRVRATIIHKSTKETGDELLQQTEQTGSLVSYAAQLLNSVRVFKLPAA